MNRDNTVSFQILPLQIGHARGLQLNRANPGWNLGPSLWAALIRL
jgi:hypothetical protein